MNHKPITGTSKCDATGSSGNRKKTDSPTGIKKSLVLCLPKLSRLAYECSNPEAILNDVLNSEKVRLCLFLLYLHYWDYVKFFYWKVCLSWKCFNSCCWILPASLWIDSRNSIWKSMSVKPVCSFSNYQCCSLCRIKASTSLMKSSWNFFCRICQ